MHRESRNGTVVKLAALLLGASLALQASASSCDRPVYLSFDTGHMEVAPFIAEVLKRHDVKVTFFLASERTKTGGHSLDEQWAPWWLARAAEGHAFGSHTWHHHSWLADLPAAGNVPARLRTRPSMGPKAGQTHELTVADYCAELQRPAERFKQMTGQPMSALFRAPGGKTSPAMLAAAQSCGWSHVGWAPAGFLGDELSSERYPNASLLKNALRDIRAGDILVAHLGIWSRRDAWAPAVLEPLITGLKARGLCFATLRDHPQLGEAARKTARSSASSSGRS